MASSTQGIVGNLNCFICHVVIPGGQKLLFKHFRLVHQKNTSDRVKDNLVCDQNGCQQTFSNFGTYRYHLQYCDKIVLGSTRYNTETFVDRHTETFVVIIITQTTVVNCNVDLFESGNHFTLANPCCTLDTPLGQIMLNLKARYHVSHAALNYLANELHTTFDLLGKMSLDNPVSSIDSLTKFNSQNKRNTFFKEHLNFAFPSEHIVSRKQVRRRNKGIVIPVFVPTTFYYISLRYTPTALFSNQKFFDLYFSETCSLDGFIRSHRDSLHFKNHR